MRANQAMALWVSVVVATAPVAARADDKGKKEAKKLLGQGDAMFAKKQYAEALGRYQRAYEAFPSPQIFYPMAQTEEKLGQDLEAILHYEQLISDAPELKADLKAEAQSRIGVIEKRLALVTFRIVGTGAAVVVDDIEVGTAPLGKPVRLKPGSHTVKITKDGFRPYTKTLELKAGKTEERVELSPAGGGGGESTRKDPDPEETTPDPGTGENGALTGGGPPIETPPGPPSSNRTWLTVGLVATGAFGAGALVTGFMARAKHATYEDETKPIDEREDARKAGKTLALVTDGLLVGAVVSAGFTAYWYWGVVKPAENDATTMASSKRSIWTPYVGAGEAGFAVMGSF